MGFPEPTVPVSQRCSRHGQSLDPRPCCMHAFTCWACKYERDWTDRPAPRPHAEWCRFSFATFRHHGVPIGVTPGELASADWMIDGAIVRVDRGIITEVVRAYGPMETQRRLPDFDGGAP